MTILDLKKNSFFAQELGETEADIWFNQALLDLEKAKSPHFKKAFDLFNAFLLGQFAWHEKREDMGRRVMAGGEVDWAIAYEARRNEVQAMLDLLDEYISQTPGYTHNEAKEMTT